jgi:hypothetical protein
MIVAMTKEIDFIISSFVFDAYLFLSEKKGAKALFVLLDAGETKALEPVMKEMDIAGLNYKIIAFGTAWDLIKKHPKAVDIYSETNAPVGLNSLKWDRFQSVDLEFLHNVYTLVPAEIVITGMVSKIQSQIGQFFKERGAEVLLYYDGFSPLTIHPFTIEMLHAASVILAPSSSVAKSIHALMPDLRIDVVGQPTLEHWINEIKRMDVQQLKSLLKLEDQKPFLVYISGYGKGYKEAFCLFVEAVQHVENFHIGISLHPRMDGTLERKILEDYKCSHVFIVPQGVPTSHVVSIADLVVNWQSTVGVQAAFLGKPVIYLDNESSDYYCLAIENGWAVKCTSVAEFLNILDSIKLETACWRERFQKSGLPRDSARIIFRKIAKNKKMTHLSRKPLKPDLSAIFKKMGGRPGGNSISHVMTY